MQYFVLVTGASSGIGEAACRQLLQEGYLVVAGVRSPTDASKLVQQYGTGIHPVLLDVTDASQIEIAIRQVSEILNGRPLVAIINNAGIVVHGAVLYVPVEEWQRQLDINVLGVVRITQAFFPHLIQPRSIGDQHPRRIINMSSVSGLFASPFLGPYSASKHALEALSDSLRRELYMYDVQVVVLEPGNVMTPVWEKAKKDKSHMGPEYDSILAYKDHLIGSFQTSGMPVEIVAKKIVKVIRASNVRARYLIREEKWKLRLAQLLPVKWVDHMIRKKLMGKSGIRKL